jgi:acyl transferase domain-containing protein
VTPERGDVGRRIAALSEHKRALLAVELAQRLDALERARHEPIAVIGMACRLPGGATTPDAYWELLRCKGDGIVEIPPDRWDVDRYYHRDPSTPGKMYTRWGGFLEGIDAFDARFFGITRREANAMDPQHRLVLEVAWEALEDAGVPWGVVAGSATGVFMGISNSDYARLGDRDPRAIGVYSGTGVAQNILSGRLSYLFDLRGPSLSIDTACSSSLVAVHLACQSLRAGESRMALVGGVNVMLAPEVTIAHCRLGFVAADGRCKVFDTRADGFVRSEGVGVVVLKRLADALADGDRVHAVILGTAVNQDGRSNGMTAPNGAAQQAVIRAALRDAGVAPREVGYVEAHGTGTVLGDPIEMDALGAVLGPGRAPGERCLVGAAKASIGHTEAAAGIAGLLKAILVLERGEVPPQVHFTTLNPNIRLADCGLAIPSEPTPWPGGPAARHAGVSSFGWSGTNAHVVCGEAPVSAAAATGPAGPLVLPISARSAEALAALARRYVIALRAHAARNGDGIAVRDVAYSASVRRTRFEHRLAVIGGSHAELADRLEAHLTGTSSDGVFAAAGAADTGVRGTPPPQSGETPDAAAVARSWAAGESLDWQTVFPDGGRYVSLPRYAWQRRRYWLDALGSRRAG